MENRKRVEIDLSGPDGNIYAVMSIAAMELEKKEASEMFNRVIKCMSYEEALSVVNEYVELIRL